MTSLFVLCGLDDGGGVSGGGWEYSVNERKTLAHLHFHPSVSLSYNPTTFACHYTHRRRARARVFPHHDQQAYGTVVTTLALDAQASSNPPNNGRATTSCSSFHGSATATASCAACKNENG